MPQMRNHFEMVNSSCSLNERARQRCQSLIDDGEALRVAVSVEAGATVIDCGVKVAGGLEAGIAAHVVNNIFAFGWAAFTATIADLQRRVRKLEDLEAIRALKSEGMDVRALQDYYAAVAAQ